LGWVGRGGVGRGGARQVGTRQTKHNKQHNLSQQRTLIAVSMTIDKCCSLPCRLDCTVKHAMRARSRYTCDEPTPFWQQARGTNARRTCTVKKPLLFSFAENVVSENKHKLYAETYSNIVQHAEKQRCHSRQHAEEHRCNPWQRPRKNYSTIV